MLRHFAGVAEIVDDLDEALRFYQDILGLVTFETPRDGWPRYHVVLILAGEGTLRPFRRGAEEVFFAPGDTILVPAEHDRLRDWIRRVAEHPMKPKIV